MKRTLLIGAGALAYDIVNVFGADRFSGVYVDAAFAPAAWPCGQLYTDLADAARDSGGYLLAIADSAHRRRAMAAAEAAGLVPVEPLLSRDCRIAPDCRIGPGSVVGEFVTIGPGATLGAHVLVMPNGTIGHGSRLLDNSVLCPGVRLSGNVTLGANCFVGPNAAFAPHVAVGDGCHVAAGAACFHDLPAGARVIGNPARVRSGRD